MGYNWAGIGGALGQGLGQGISAQLDQKMKMDALNKQLQYVKNLPEGDRGLFFQMQGAQKGSDPLTAFLLQRFLTNEQGMPTAPQAVKKFKRIKDETGKIYLQDDAGKFYNEDGTLVE